MKVMTKAEYDALPIIDGMRQCPGNTDYSQIKNIERATFDKECVFGAGCQFGEDCWFDVRCVFGEQCQFGAGCVFSEWCAFSEGCVFSEGCRFYEGCRFGEDCVFRKSCEFGVRCGFGARSTFGERCLFGALCRFDNMCQFGDWCRFGEECGFGAECQIESIWQLIDTTIYIASGFGIVNRTTFGYAVSDGVLIRCGCWLGLLDQFRERVRCEHGDTIIAREYLMLADLFEMRRARLGPYATRTSSN